MLPTARSKQPSWDQPSIPKLLTARTGLKMIAEPYMKNVNGEYVDAAGKVVTEADKVANPAYSSKVKIAVNV